MSETPRTDEQAIRIMFGNLDTIVPVEFARQLETELADKDRQLAEITRQRNAYKKALETAEDELMTVRAEIERLRGVIISQITPEPLVLSSYSATAEPAKDERDKLIEQMREALQEVMVLCDAVPTRAHDMAKDYHLREIGRIVNVKGLYHVVKAALSATEREENEKTCNHS